MNPRPLPRPACGLTPGVGITRAGRGARVGCIRCRRLSAGDTTRFGAIIRWNDKVREAHAWR